MRTLKSGLIVDEQRYAFFNNTKLKPNYNRKDNTW